MTSPAKSADALPPDTGDIGHVAALDGVRGVAILMIFVDHFMDANTTAANPVLQFILQLRAFTWTGVYLFFVLSGFLITGILFDTLNTENYFRTFFSRRILRIFPLYYGVLLLLALLTHPLHLDWHGRQWMLWTYMVNRPFAPNFGINPAPYINLRHFWSLAVEEQFYLFWPFAVFLARTWKAVFTLAVCGALLSLGFRVYLALHGENLQFHSIFGAADALLPGALLALLVRSRIRQHVLQWGLPVFLGGATGALWMWMRALNLSYTAPQASPDSDPLFGTVGITLLACSYAALIAAALHHNTLVHSLFSTPFLRFFGKYSYGMYVFHYSLDAAFTIPMRSAMISHHVPRAVAIVLVALVLSAASTAIAWLSYHLYEKHFLKLKRYFVYKRRKPAPVERALLY